MDDKTQPLPLLQDEPRDHPLSSDDVRSFPAFASERRGSFAGTRHRHQPRNGSILVEQIWPAVCRRDSQEKGQPDACIFKLEVALGRSLAMSTNRKPAAGKTTGLRIHTSHLDEESGPCFDLGGCEPCRNSSPSTPQSTTISTRSATSTVDQSSS